MTVEPRDSLRRRFLVAFAAVAVVAVALVAAAGLVGADRGLSSQSDEQRRQVAVRVADAAAAAYEEAGGWAGADLSRASSVAQGGGANLVVLTGDGEAIWPRGRRGTGMGMGMGAGRVAADVSVEGIVVGEVVLGFRIDSAPPGRPVAWTWILVAGVATLLLALVAAWLVSRQLTRPVVALTEAARSFAAGERDTVVSERGVGELGELADAFEEAVAAVRRAEGSRARMAADVAHELRTPLAALQAGLEELRDGLAPADPAALARLHDQSLRISQIVGDLDSLFAAEGSARGVRRDRVDLSALARQETAARAAQLRVAELDVGVSLPTGRPVWAVGDAERLHQVLGNLLENCVRHCRPGDSVDVRVAGQEGADTVTLTVADTGPGIAPDDLPHVFDRFWRGPRQTGRPGSGLGLAVVRSLVEAQHGSVAVESDDRTGTTVTVSLPAPPDLGDGASPAPEASRQPLR